MVYCYWNSLEWQFGVMSMLLVIQNYDSVYGLIRGAGLSIRLSVHISLRTTSPKRMKLYTVAV